MFKFLSDPKRVSKTPIFTLFLLEYANIGQIYRIWHERTAAGQNVWSWVSVNIALWAWLNFYRVCCPSERFAFWATVFGIVMNSAVILSVVWLRYF